ncbi:unnamed protein product, partial [Phaeothamnion confervicola]
QPAEEESLQATTIWQHYVTSALGMNESRGAADDAIREAQILAANPSHAYRIPMHEAGVSVGAPSSIRADPVEAAGNMSASSLAATGLREAGSTDMEENKAGAASENGGRPSSPSTSLSAFVISISEGLFPEATGNSEICRAALTTSQKTTPKNVEAEPAPALAASAVKISSALLASSSTPPPARSSLPSTPQILLSMPQALPSSESPPLPLLPPPPRLTLDDSTLHGKWLKTRHE